MSNALLDQNGRQTMIGISSVDGTIEPVFVDPVNHQLHVNDSTSGSDIGNNSGNAMLDENSRQVLIAESSDGSGTLIEIYVDDSTGALLVNSQ